MFFLSFIAYPQKKEQKLDTVSSNYLEEIIVTATRTKKQLSSIPMPVTLVSKKQIKRSGLTRLRDILLEQTGVTVVKESFGGFEGVQLQGIDADYTLILIDGAPIVGRISGNIDLNRISVNSIKQIEIVKGPSSALYGSEAMGGVINIITETPDKEQLKGQYHVLTRQAKNELDINANATYSKNKFGLNATVNLNSSSGFDLTPLSESKTVYPHKNYTLGTRLLYRFTDKLKFDASTRYFEQEQYFEENENFQNDLNINTLLKHQISGKLNIDYIFYATVFSSASSFFNPLDNEELEELKTTYRQSFIRPEIKVQYNFLNKNSLIFGLGATRDRLDRASINGVKEYNAAYTFAQLDFKPIKNINLIFGYRYENSDSYRSAFSPKVSLSFEPIKQLMFRGSVGYGFKVPDFRQLYFNFRNLSFGYIVLGTFTVHELFGGNIAPGELSKVQKQLKPESSIGYNFGFQLKPLKGLVFSTNFFRNDIKDLINIFITGLDATKIGLREGTTIFSYQNINSVFTQGIELELRYRINKNINLLAGYQLLYTGNNDEIFKVKDGVYYKDTSGDIKKLSLSSYFGLANRSRHMLNAKLFYENYKHGFGLNLRGIYRSQFAPFDSNINAVIDQFDNFVKPNTQINIALNKTLFNSIDVQLGVDNIFNETGIKNKELFNRKDKKSGNIVANENFLQLGRSFYGRIQINI